MTFAWLCRFRPLMAQAIEARDAAALESLRKVAMKQVAELEAQITDVRPLIDWPALAESWRRDLSALTDALEQTCESR